MTDDDPEWTRFTETGRTDDDDRLPFREVDGGDTNVDPSVDTHDGLSRLDRDDADRFIVDRPESNDETLTVDSLVPDDGGFFDGEAPITVGRVLYDTSSERYCAVRETTDGHREVTVAYLRRTDDGRHDTPHGRLQPTDDTLTVDWRSEGGRFVPK